MPKSRWTAVIVNYNSADYLPACLAALDAATHPPAEVIVVDNASTDDALEVLRGYPEVRVLAQEVNRGFSGGANAGLDAVGSEFALILNADVEIDAEFGGALEAAFDRHADVAAVGPLLFFPESDRMQHAGGWVILPRVLSNHRGYGQPVSAEFLEEADVDYVIGGAMGLRMQAVRAVGGFDERFQPAYYEDMDLCFVLRAAGWRTRYIPSLRGIHHEGVVLRGSAAAHRFMHANRLRFALKHLTPEQWRRDFIPAEIEDLRRRVADASGPWWPDVTKATALEAVLRNPDLPGLGTPAAPLDADLLDRLRLAHERVRDAATLPDPPPLERIAHGPDRADQLALEVRRLRAFAEDLRDRQQAFNVSMLDALSAQDRMNREQLALVLTLALDALQHLPAGAAEGSEPA
jgi:GT2 family glycosyltransferase